MPPELSFREYHEQRLKKVDQRSAALLRGNRIRIERARLKEKVASGDLTVHDVLIGHRQSVQTMPIGTLLLAQHQWGKKKVNKFLNQLNLTAGKPIGSMTDRQIWAVIGQLGERRKESDV